MHSRLHLKATPLRVLLALSAAALLMLPGCGKHQGPGNIEGAALPTAVVETEQARQRGTAQALEVDNDKQILFGDLHVHTTFSPDAFTFSLPVMQGEGAHPPADACDFARYCSGLDFWSINDHAEGLTPRHWQETVDSVRQCNALAGDPDNPDVVAYLGWEWTQVGQTPSEHWGHKDVILRDLDEDSIPSRPIAARSLLIKMLGDKRPLKQRLLLPLADLDEIDQFLAFNFYQDELLDTPDCEAGIDTRQLPNDCIETALDPAELFEKLAQWGHESIVIPHGTAWGVYTPPGSSFDKQLKGAQHDPERQILLEVFSGHGNSEEYRDWREDGVAGDNGAVCPEATENYLPCCRRAGQLVRERCENPDSASCEQLVTEAQTNHLEAGQQGHLTLPWAEAQDWLDCGQCRDCFLPSFNYRPRNSAQYTLALTGNEADGDARRFRFGFMASSDNHSARPGTGYKEYARYQMTEARGVHSRFTSNVLRGEKAADNGESQAFVATDAIMSNPMLALEAERVASFFVTGGLVAVHSGGRDRDSIWQAMKRREVYGTSGPRILLWFDLLNGPDGELAMGGEADMTGTPRFRVRAAGSLEQEQGCPEHSEQGLSPARLERLCRGECYNPTDRRRPIERIEVVRVRARRPGNLAEAQDDSLAELIEDPWKILPCPADGNGCTVEFDDPEQARSDREHVYYVRAIERATPTVNADTLRCKYDDDSNCEEVDPCWGADFRTPNEEDCLATAEPRAWSSPIYLR